MTDNSIRNVILEVFADHGWHPVDDIMAKVPGIYVDTVESELRIMEREGLVERNGTDWGLVERRASE